MVDEDVYAETGQVEVDRLLNAHEIAEQTGMTVHQVYRRLKRGDIPSTMGGLRGQQYMVRETDLQRYVDAGKPLSAPKRDGSMLTVPQVAQLTGFTEETVRRLCYSGVLGYVRGAGRCGHLRIYTTSVNAYMAQYHS